jgi:peptide/nickel transport system substrate-binding protein
VSRLTAALVAILLAVAACTSSDGSGERPTDPDAALRGGTLRVAVSNRYVFGVDVDPATYYLWAWELSRCCLLRTLYSYNGKPGEEGGAEVRPDLAQGMPEVSNDGLTWTFRLKRGLRYAPPFEDTPIVAPDIVRALKRQARAGPDSPSGDYGRYYSTILGFDDYPEEASSIVGLESPDDRTLVVRLTEITGDLPYRFSLPATAPIPEGASEGHDADYGRFLVASGPYMVEGSEDLDFSVPPEQQEPTSGFVPARLNKDGEVVEPGSLALVRNPSWDPETDRLRPAYPDRIEMAIGGGDGELFAERVDAAEIDVVLDREGSPFEQIARYQEAPASDDRVHSHANNIGYAITMNLAMPPFDDVHVRRAVSHAIDEEALAEMLSEPKDVPFGGTSVEPGTHIAPDGIQGSLLLRAFDPYPYDPSDAREEMSASAYDRTGDGTCDASVCRNVRALVVDDGFIPRQAKKIRDALADLGIELTLEIVSDRFYRLVDDPSEHNQMIIAWGWITDYPEGTGWFLSLFDVSGLYPRGGGCCHTNTSLLGASPQQLSKWGYEVTSVPSVDDRFDACQQRRGVARTQCWAEYDQYLMSEIVPWVPYMFMEQTVVVSERVVEYSVDAFTSMPALDQIALAPGSE